MRSATDDGESCRERERKPKREQGGAKNERVKQSVCDFFFFFILILMSRGDSGEHK